jgi:DNA-binding SARP family transcriptional activator
VRLARTLLSFAMQPEGTRRQHPMILAARLLGGFELRVDGQLLAPGDFERPSGRRLLCLLLLAPNHRIRREEAAEVLWPDAQARTSSANLRKALHFCRRALARGGAGSRPVIASHANVLRFSPDVILDVDHDRLTRALDQLDILSMSRTADDDASAALLVLVALGGLDLLPDEAHEDWFMTQSQRLRNRVQRHLVRAARMARDKADLEAARTLTAMALERDPADETAHRLAIELHLASGELYLAQRQLGACADALANECGVLPPPDLVALVTAALSDRRARDAFPARSRHRCTRSMCAECRAASRS